MLDVDTRAGRSETAVRQRYLVPGLPVSVSDLTDTLGGYASRIVDVDDRLVWIDLPMRRDGMLSLAVGQLVTVRFDRPDDAVYLFDSVVADRNADDHAPFGIAMPVTINRRPRRSDTRLAMIIDAAFDVDGTPTTAGKVVDVSAGGLGLICEPELDPDADVRVRCEIPGPDGSITIEQRARVQTVSLYGRTPGGATLHHYGLRFTDASEEVRERIVSAIIWNLTASMD